MFGSREPKLDLKSRAQKLWGQFLEDKDVVSQSPVFDYSFVLHRWLPTKEYPSTTEWNEGEGDKVEFKVTVRLRTGPITVIVQRPLLKDRTAKTSYTEKTRREILRALNEAEMR